MNVKHRSPDPLIRKRRRDDAYGHPLLHFWDKIEMIPESGCWVWTGSVNGRYPKIWDGRRGYVIFAHRFSWTIFRGSIPNGMEIDHKCRVKLCVNPSHLEPVTRSENLKRMVRARRRPGAI